jgi:hypothetical protein
MDVGLPSMWQFLQVPLAALHNILPYAGAIIVVLFHDYSRAKLNM